MIATSTLSSKGQITVPKEIREHLGVHPGDTLIYETRDDTIILKRLESFDAAFHATLAGTLDEWATEEDETAFRDL